MRGYVRFLAFAGARGRIAAVGRNRCHAARGRGRIAEQRTERSAGHLQEPHRNVGAWRLAVVIRPCRLVVEAVRSGSVRPVLGPYAAACRSVSQMARLML